MSRFNALEIPITNTPTVLPAKGNIKVYKKPQDGSIYQLNSEGVETLLIPAGFDPTIVMVSTSLIPLTPGMIVRLDNSTPFSVTHHLGFFQPDNFGVVKEGGGFGDRITVQYGGIIDVEMDTNTTNIGDYIYSGATPQVATSSNFAIAGVLGRALTYKPPDIGGEIQIPGIPTTVTVLLNFFAHLG